MGATGHGLGARGQEQSQQPLQKSVCDALEEVALAGAQKAEKPFVLHWARGAGRHRRLHRKLVVRHDVAALDANFSASAALVGSRATGGRQLQRRSSRWQAKTHGLWRKRVAACHYWPARRATRPHGRGQELAPDPGEKKKTPTH